MVLIEPFSMSKSLTCGGVRFRPLQYFGALPKIATTKNIAKMVLVEPHVRVFGFGVSASAIFWRAAAGGLVS